MRATCHVKFVIMVRVIVITLDRTPQRPVVGAGISHALSPFHLLLCIHVLQGYFFNDSVCMYALSLLMILMFLL